MVSGIDDVKWLYENGVRLFGLIWNVDNNFGYSHNKKDGLTEEGKGFVRNMFKD